MPKRWGSFSRSTALNAALLREFAGAGAQILATVPAQHMYGMETSVLLPLLGAVGISLAGRVPNLREGVTLADLRDWHEAMDMVSHFG